MLRSLGLALAALLTGSVAALAIEPSPPERLLTEEDAVGLRLRHALDSLDKGKDGATEGEIAALRAFYSAHGSLLWIDKGALDARGTALIDTLSHADDYGLKAADYRLPDSMPGKPGAPLTLDQMASTDLKLSLLALHYAHDAHVGHFSPDQVSTMIDRGSTPPDPQKVIDGVAMASDVGADLLTYHPRHPQFELLRKKLLELRGGKPVAQSLAASQASVASVDMAGEDAISSKPQVRMPAGPRLAPGDRHPQVVLLRKRLGSFLPPDATAADNEFYDDVLAVALRKFQSDHGLSDDGVLTRTVRIALNRDLNPGKIGTEAAPAAPSDTSSQQIERILVNMQRWRWMREDMGNFYVLDNVPEFLTRVIDHDKVVFTERIVSGKPDTPTPTFSQNMQFIEFNPFWNVPNSIKLNEILPKLREGSDIMQVQNLVASYHGRQIDAYSVDWETTDIRNFDFQQPPGGENVLGVVKFMFPNHFDVYMHDTPTKTLFNQTVRAYSHGCMRVRNPDQFAAVILGHDKGWTIADVQRAIQSGENQQVKLTSPIPVHVAYFTAWVQSDGSLATFGDWYGHDQRMALALNGQTQLLAAEVNKEKNKPMASPEPDPFDPGPGAGTLANASKR